MQARMDVAHTRRLLIFSLTPAPSQAFLSSLLGSADGSLPDQAGSSYILTLKTAYYTAAITVWLDEVQDVTDWRTAWLEEEAKEVLDVLGGVIILFEKPASDAEYVCPISSFK